MTGRRVKNDVISARNMRLGQSQSEDEKDSVVCLSSGRYGKGRAASYPTYTGTAAISAPSLLARSEVLTPGRTDTPFGVRTGTDVLGGAS